VLSAMEAVQELEQLGALPGAQHLGEVGHPVDADARRFVRQ
jgi:hypothetical protein